MHKRENSSEPVKAETVKSEIQDNNNETMVYATEPTETERRPKRRKWVAYDDAELERFIKRDHEIFIPGTKESQEWRDNDMDDFQGLEYEHCTLKDFLTIGHGWLCSLYEGQLEELAPVTVWLALHLRTLDDKKGLLFKVEWQKPYGTSQELKNVTSPQMIKKLENLSNFESSENVIEPLMGKRRSGSYFSESRKMLATIKSMPDLLRANFYSFLATIVCRVITNNPLGICDFFEHFAISCFISIYNIHDDNANTDQLPLSLLSPRHFIIGRIAQALKPCSPLTICLLKGFLTRQKILRDKDYTGNNLGLLDELLLHHISMNGLEIVQFATAAMKELKLSGFGQLFHDFYGRTQAKSLKHLSKFSDLYLSHSSNDMLYPWATLFSSTYFADLSLKDNSLAAALFLAVVDPEGKGNIWNSESLMLKSEEKIYILALAQQYRVKMMKTRFHSEIQYKSWNNKSLLGTLDDIPEKC